MLVKTQTETPVTIAIEQFHKDVATCAMHGIRTAETVAKKMVALVTARYGEKAPTFEQYKADLAAFKVIAEQRKLASEQWLVRPYGAALKTQYKELPVSMAPDAVAKRKQREDRDALVKSAIAAAKKTTEPVGAKQGETQERQPSETEQIEQLVSRVGLWETLYACIRILASDESTKAQATHLQKMADKAHDVANKADKAARAAAGKTAIDSAAATLASLAK